MFRLHTADHQAVCGGLLTRHLIKRDALLWLVTQFLNSCDWCIHSVMTGWFFNSCDRRFRFSLFVEVFLRNFTVDSHRNSEDRNAPITAVEEPTNYTKQQNNFYKFCWPARTLEFTYRSSGGVCLQTVHRCKSSFSFQELSLHRNEQNRRWLV